MECRNAFDIYVFQFEFTLLVLLFDVSVPIQCFSDGIEFQIFDALHDKMEKLAGLGVAKHVVESQAQRFENQDRRATRVCREATNNGAKWLVSAFFVFDIDCLLNPF
jgi:hypothetical protein